MKIAHILVATDLSQAATSCIPSVADLARSVNARVTLLATPSASAISSFVAPCSIAAVV